MKSYQQGISLPVMLALLVGMALLGAATLQSGVLQTRMAIDQHTRNLAFQAAEGALRAGEQLAASGALPSGTGCSGGLCATPAANAIERWQRPGFGGWQSVVGEDSDGLPAAQFMTEYMGQAPSAPDCEHAQPIADTCLRPLYRITARSTGAQGITLLQSHYLGARISWREVESD